MWTRNQQEVSQLKPGADLLEGWCGSSASKMQSELRTLTAARHEGFREDTGSCVGAARHSHLVVSA